MWVSFVYGGVLVALVLTDLWLLREVDALRRQVEAYQNEVASLDDRVCQLMVSVEDAAGYIAPDRSTAASCER